MGSRYTKSIPEFVYFTDQGNGWYAGPFVKNPCKGKNANSSNLIICKVQVVPRLVDELPQVLPIATRPAERPFTDEELQKLEAWLKSDEGREKIRQSQIDADKAFDALGLRDIDPIKLREPFNI